MESFQITLKIRVLSRIILDNTQFRVYYRESFGIITLYLERKYLKIIVFANILKTSLEQKPKLLDQVRAVARARHRSHKTEDAYHNFIKRFILFHNKRHPQEMGAEEITAFLTHLAVNEKVSSSTQNQAFFSLLFLYRDVLRINLPNIEGVVRAKRPEHLPVVFTPAETKLILANLSGVPFLVASLLYGAGLRLTEALHLRVKDIDFEMNQITVRDGKGAKDRTTLLPELLH